MYFFGFFFKIVKRYRVIYIALYNFKKMMMMMMMMMIIIMIIIIIIIIIAGD